jgi:putative ABC transport system ATP-binding protein
MAYGSTDSGRTTRRRNQIGLGLPGFNLLADERVANVELPCHTTAGAAAGHLRSPAALEASGWPTPRASAERAVGGQQQRVAIARALVTEPALVLADEPTGNLDSRTSIEVMALFQQLNAQGITIVVVTHEADVAAYATRIVQMRDGRIFRDEPVTDRHDAARDLAGLDRSAA